MSMAVTASEQDLRTLTAIVTGDREDLPAQGPRRACSAS